MAEDYERKAVLRLPSDPSVLAHMAEIYAHNGKLSLGGDGVGAFGEPVCDVAAARGRSCGRQQDAA